MKIEKINDNQIKCTLTSEDLSERQIKLSELAYGSEKARMLLHDMIQMAETEYGFAGEDMPIIVEAIPTSPTSLVMIITKVDNPDELDGRFSRFTPYTEESENYDEPPVSEMFGKNKLENQESNDDNLLNEVLRELTNLKKSLDAGDEDGPLASLRRIKTIRVEGVYRSFEFDSLERAAEYAGLVIKDFRGRSSLYRDPKNHRYFLVLFLRGAEADSFNRACNMACEFATAVKSESLSYYNEFYKRIAKGNAIEKLCDIASIKQ